MVAKSYADKWPRKRWLLGYSEFEIRTRAPVQRVIEILNDNVAVKNRLLAQKPKPFLGCVDSDEFVVKYDCPRKQRVYGRVREEDEGATLVIAMQERAGPITALYLSILPCAAEYYRANRGALHRYAFFFCISASIIFAVRSFLYLLFCFDIVCIRRKLSRMFD
jgi:hypothetical protein